jgi:anti-sigma factor RsiW
VLSSDQHTVKPWFNGKVDFAPSVADYAAAGFKLVGGRVDYIGGRPVAVAVYARRKHFVNVFMWPAASDEKEPPRARDFQGYRLLGWKRSGLAYWAVSDASADDLESLARLFAESGSG